MTYFLHLFAYFEIYALVAMSLNLLMGYAGLLQVAQAGYFGVGAYTLALLAPRLGFPGGLLGSGVLAGALSLLTSLPAWRFRGDAFILMSIAAQLGIFAILYNWTGLTGGPFGIPGIHHPAILGIRFDTIGAQVALFGVVVLAGIAVLAVLKRSPFGRSLQAMRDDELAARSLGIPVRRLKLQAFAVSSALVGIAGALFASHATYIDPTSFGLDQSLLMLSMVVVGGAGNLRGPLLGALTLIALPELLRLSGFPSAIAANLRLLAYGLLLIVLMLWRPQGLAGRYRLE